MYYTEHINITNKMNVKDKLTISFKGLRDYNSKLKAS